MTLPQASSVPIKNRDSIETVTLKNLIALDLVEKNENLLKVLTLFDDSKTKIKLGEPLTDDKLKELIELKQKEIEQEQDEIKKLKQSLNESTNKDNELINNLSKEFLNSSSSSQVQDADELILQFEKENNVLVKFNQDSNNYRQHSLDFGLNFDSKPDEPQQPEQTEQSQKFEQLDQPVQQHAQI